MDELILKSSIMKDIRNGMKWGKVAEKYDVPMSFVHSTYSKSKNATSPTKKVGGNGRRWNGWRIHDGEESPVTTYHISELE